MFTKKDLHVIRKKWDMTYRQLADWLYMFSKNSDRQVRRWEYGEAPIPGPVVKAIELQEEVTKLKETIASKK